MKKSTILLVATASVLMLAGCAKTVSAEEAKDIRGHFNVGDEIDVLILRKENQEGYPILSKRRVDQDIAWDRLAQLKQDKERDQLSFFDPQDPFMGNK